MFHKFRFDEGEILSIFPLLPFNYLIRKRHYRDIDLVEFREEYGGKDGRRIRIKFNNSNLISRLFYTEISYESLKDVKVLLLKLNKEEIRFKFVVDLHKGKMPIVYRELFDFLHFNKARIVNKSYFAKHLNHYEILSRRK
jgi:hypothetical protein